ncbi:thioredoxin family protein [Candidatus Kaiserbacteria bacterium]|nr:thioredoxin family protein [Candidatus Kaiserbacteria bacterium]
MNTNNVLIIAIIAIVILGGGYWLFSGGLGGTDDSMMEDETKEGEMMEKDDSMMEDDSKGESTMMKDEGAMMEKGSYEAYAASKLAMAQSGDVVLFFKADWCPTCRALDADIRANLSSIPRTLSILTLNYDTEQALKQKYGVTYQHTLVQVSSDGSLIKKWSGSPTLASLVVQIQ